LTQKTKSKLKNSISELKPIVFGNQKIKNPFIFVQNPFIFASFLFSN
jgi:hypothetical protein